MMEIAKLQDYEEIMSFYNDIINHTSQMKQYARWKKDIYPAKEDIMKYIKSQNLYVLKEQGKIQGAFALTWEQSEEYHNILWKFLVKDNEVAVLHILGIAPFAQKKGLGRKLLNEAMRLSMEKKKKVVRLDALATNIPAHRLYEKYGFVFRGKQELYAANTGLTTFYYYEYLLDNAVYK